MTRRISKTFDSNMSYNQHFTSIKNWGLAAGCVWRRGWEMNASQRLLKRCLCESDWNVVETCNVVKIYTVERIM